MKVRPLLVVSLQSARMRKRPCSLLPKGSSGFYWAPSIFQALTFLGRSESSESELLTQIRRGSKYRWGRDCRQCNSSRTMKSTYFLSKSLCGTTSIGKYTPIALCWGGRRRGIFLHLILTLRLKGIFFHKWDIFLAELEQTRWPEIHLQH